jgi:hypothetical protein
LSTMHLFKNRLMFNLICEFPNNFLRESSVHYIILVPKSWKLHQIFKFVFRNFDIYSIPNIFLKLYKEDATTTPMASCRLFVIVNKVPCPWFHQKSSNDIQNHHFLNLFYFILKIFSHMYVPFLQFWYRWVLNGAY